jgi:hypothetical protein
LYKKYDTGKKLKRKKNEERKEIEKTNSLRNNNLCIYGTVACP